MAFCVLQFSKTESVITVQCVFRQLLGIDPPVAKNICRWFKQFEESGVYVRGRAQVDHTLPRKMCTKIQEVFSEACTSLLIVLAENLRFFIRLKKTFASEAIPIATLCVSDRRKCLDYYHMNKWRTTDSYHSWFFSHLALHSWPPRSSDITPCDILLWGYVKQRWLGWAEKQNQGCSNFCGRRYSQTRWGQI